MTSTSGFRRWIRGPVAAGRGWTPPASGILRYWLASCLFLGASGCLYTGPVLLEPDVNTPPEIHSYLDGRLTCDDQTLEEYGEDTICITDADQIVFLTAIDEDDDVLDFYWEGSGSGVIATSVETYTGDFQTSQITLYRESVVDGEELRCTVSDGSQDWTTQSWTLRVI